MELENCHLISGDSMDCGHESLQPSLFICWVSYLPDKPAGIILSYTHYILCDIVMKTMIKTIIYYLTGTY